MEIENHVHDNLSCSCGHCHNDNVQENEKKTEIGVFTRFKFDFIKIIISLALFVVAEIVKVDFVKIILFVCSAMVVGYELVFGFIKNVIKGKIFDEHTLMLIASVTAFIIGFYSEGALIVLLFYVGETLESVATYNSKRKIAGLSDIKSTLVHLIDKNGASDVEPKSVEVGSLIQVKKGERVPIDGILLAGNAEFDTKAVTGESKPYYANAGKNVFGGTVNVGETVILKTTKLYKDSTVEQIISMVEGSLSKKSKTQKFITSFAKIYTPIVALLAVLVAVVPPLFDQMNFYKWIYKALTFLVISCPCALVISVPLAFFVGIGALAKNGVLVKGSSYIDALSNLKTVACDKTGTVTKGNMIVKQLNNLSCFSDDYVKSLLYAVEDNSTHTISRSIVNAYCEFKFMAKVINVTKVEEIVGRGITSCVDDKRVLIGNDKLMQENAINFNSVNYDETIICLAIDGKLVATVFMGDEIKSETVDAFLSLRKLGVNKLFMLSGDNKVTAEKIGKIVGFDKVYSELLPKEKLKMFNKIKKDCNGGVCYVGDGFNDTPTLAAADVGVSMGALGSEIAIESSDVVIMNDDLSKLPISINHAKKIRSIVIQNIVFSLVVKFLVMILSVIFNIPVWISMLADVGVMILAVLNSLRNVKIKKI